MPGFRKIVSFLGLIPLFVIILSCSEENTASRSTPPVSAKEIKIVRFDQELCKTAEQSDNQLLEDLLDKYPIFTDVFFNQVIFPRNTESIQLNELIRNYCAAPAIQHLIDTSRILFPDLRQMENELGLAFGYYQNYFPEQPVPKVFTYVSEFGLGTFTVDHRVLAIGLDFFLGEDYPYYDPAVFSAYLRKTMSSEFMVSKAIRTLTQGLLPSVSKGNMLDFMIRNGKIIYLTSMLLPDSPMHKICLYTPEQMEWVQDNELNIWSWLLDLGYFYESDQRKFKKFTDPAPNTPGLPQEAPGRIANWIGYRIVESYMNHHPDVTLKELADNTDFQSIMDRSKYKPNRPQ
ncbi:hypothetical protein KUV50_09325 [Membranicola marinus]|uniref:Gliding motility-associated lipoprotein GldB n=1 Tax=Membranihabitans marinus TaxID=1227546 RepID=A0A953HU29_9BACT|nr:hypothetical protein [Membranihabitans marinus]MBY5958330.1 hypothetical protein [Membranihabitans marinus]